MKPGPARGDHQGPWALPVLIVGPPGAGKRELARRIHRQGTRRRRWLWEVHCPGLGRGPIPDQPPPGGMVHDLLLVSVDHLTAPAQTWVMALLKDRCPWESPGPGPCDHRPRAIATCAADPQTLVESGRLRGDLLYRINVVQLTLPLGPKRPADVVLLAELFLTGAARALGRVLEGLGAGAAQVLAGRPWPGGWAQLEQVMTLAAANCPGGLVDACHLPLV